MDSHEGFFVGGFTLALVIATILLWRATNDLYQAGERQIGIAKTAADAAMLSARAAIGIQLPIDQMVPDTINSSSVRNGDSLIVSYGVYGVRITNLGKTQMFPVQINSGMTFGGALPAEPNYRFTDAFGINTIIEPNPTDETYKRLNECSVVIPDDAYDRLKDRSARVWFYCDLIYTDFMGETRHRAFCWEWRYYGMGFVWTPDPTAAYNRKT